MTGLAQIRGQRGETPAHRHARTTVSERSGIYSILVSLARYLHHTANSAGGRRADKCLVIWRRRRRSGSSPGTARRSKPMMPISYSPVVQPARRDDRSDPIRLGPARGRLPCHRSRRDRRRRRSGAWRSGSRPRQILPSMARHRIWALQAGATSRRRSGMVELSSPWITTRFSNSPGSPRARSGRFTRQPDLGALGFGILAADGVTPD